MVAGVAVQRGAGGVSRGGDRYLEEIHRGLHDSDAGGNRAHAPQVTHWVRGVVEHAEEEHDVERRAERVRADFLHRDVSHLHPAAQGAPGQFEVAAGVAPRPVPHPVIAGYHSGGAAPLGLEGEEPVVGPDVQDAAASQVGQVEVLPLRGSVLMARSVHAIPQVDGVKPGASRHRLAQLGRTRLDVRVHSHRQHPDQSRPASETGRT